MRLSVAPGGAADGTARGEGPGSGGPGGCANELLGCATSRPTGHLDPPVMHETDRRCWAVLGAFGGGADGDGARSEIVTDASACVSVVPGVCRMLTRLE